MKKQFLIIHFDGRHILDLWYFFAEDLASLAEQIVDNQAQHRPLLHSLRGLRWDCDSNYYESFSAGDLLDALCPKNGQTISFETYVLPLDNHGLNEGKLISSYEFEEAMNLLEQGQLA